MAARRTAPKSESGTTDVPETVKPKPSQISHVAIVGGAPDMPEGSGVVDYLLAYMGRRVSFYNPLTGETDEREAAEVIALQMVIGALYGDKSAINRVIERTEGKVGVGGARGAAREAGAATDPNDPRNIAIEAERARQAGVRAREDAAAEGKAIAADIGVPVPLTAMKDFAVAVMSPARTGEETIM